MTREEKKQAKLKLKQDVADAKQTSKEVAEKVKTLTPDKLTLKDYEDWQWIKNGPDKSSAYKDIKLYLGFVSFVIFMCSLFTASLAAIFSFHYIAATVLFAICGVAGDSVCTFEIVKYAKKLNEIKADKTFAIYHELKKQKLLGKLDEVFNEYAKTDKCKQEYAAREEENLIASVESQKDWVGEQIGIAEQQTRILPKLLKLLQENDAHSRYEIEMDANKETATIRPAERGYAITEVAGKINNLIKDGVDIKFEY